MATNRPLILRSPNLAEGGDLRVVRLYEVTGYARGGLASKREVAMHVTPKEADALRMKWGAPGPSGYRFPTGSLRRMARMADGGEPPTASLAGPLQDASLIGFYKPQPIIPGGSTPATDAGGFRSRTTSAVPDYYTYGEGPEHTFFQSNVVPGQPTFPHTDPSIPTTQPSGSASGAANAALLGSVLSGGSALAGAAGVDNAFTQGAGAIGKGLTGNYAGAAKDASKLYQGLAGTGAGLGSVGSGAAANSALADAGFGASWTTPAITTGTEAAGATGAVGAGGAGGAGAGAGSTGALASSGLATAIPIAAIGWAAADLANKSLVGHGDEKRNQAAFEANFPGIKRIQPGRGAGMFLLPDGRLISAKEYDELAGTFYGAAYAPDGNQADWQKKYAEANARIGAAGPSQMKDPSAFISNFVPGYHWDASTQRVVKDEGHASGGRFGGAGSSGPWGAKDPRDTTAQRYIRGPGTGRSDSIDAKLSDGEYVMTAEDVALLGDGSSEAGARRLDDFRKNLRKHKGGALAKGKISPNAKAPMAYLKGTR